MLLRRIAEHVKAQNWFAVFLDFMIVVVGVFIGIQVANWNQTRADHQTEATYLELLCGDLRSTMANAETQIEFEQFQTKLANETFLLVGEAPSETRRQKLAIALSQLGTRRTLKVDSPTFLDLQSSGKLGLVSDSELRNEIVAYFIRVDRLEAVLEKNNDVYIDGNFNDLLEDLNIGYWLWDAKIMQSKIFDHDEYDNFLRQRVAAPLQRAGGAVLLSPPEAEVWERVAAHLSTRASIAVLNESFTVQLLQATTALEEKIASHLEGSGE